MIINGKWYHQLNIYFWEIFFEYSILIITVFSYYKCCDRTRSYQQVWSHTEISKNYRNIHTFVCMLCYDVVLSIMASSMTSNSRFETISECVWGTDMHVSMRACHTHKVPLLCGMHAWFQLSYLQSNRFKNFCALLVGSD